VRPPDRYRALAISLLPWSCSRWRRIIFIPKTGSAHARLKRLIRPRYVSHQQGAYSRESERVEGEAAAKPETGRGKNMAEKMR